MSEETIRQPDPAELEGVHMMGFDAWGEGRSKKAYLRACEKSPKYKSGQWWVLERDGELVSSLLLHRFEGAAGLGSIATAPAHRGKGCSARLIEAVLAKLDAEGSAPVYLYSDIRPSYYERFGFSSLASDKQLHLPSLCMVRGDADPAKAPPPYF